MKQGKMYHLDKICNV